MVIRLPFQKYEAAVLLDAYLTALSGKLSKTQAIKKCSQTLRTIAINSKLEIDDSFRNPVGISSQFCAMESAYQGKTITRPATQQFIDIVTMYFNDNQAYQELLHYAQTLASAPNIAPQINNNASITTREETDVLVDFTQVYNTSFSNTQPTYFIYKNQQITVQTWKLLYCEICERLIADYGQSVIHNINYDRYGVFSLNCVTESNKHLLYEPLPIADDHYLETRRDAKFIMQIIVRLYNIYALKGQLSIAYGQVITPSTTPATTATKPKASSKRAKSVLLTTLVTDSSDNKVSSTEETDTDLLLVKFNDAQLPSFTNTKPNYFIYKTQEKVEVTTWQQVYVQICTKLLSEYRYDLLNRINLNKNNPNSLLPNIVTEPQTLNEPCHLLCGYYVDGNLDTSIIMHKLQKVVQIYSLQNQIIVAYTKETEPKATEPKTSLSSTELTPPTTIVTNSSNNNVSHTVETNTDMLLVKLNDEKLPSFTNTKPNHFSYKTQEKVEVTTWLQVYTQICNKFINEYGTNFFNLIDNKDDPDSVMLNIVEEKQKHTLHIPCPLLYGYYIEGNLDASAIVHKLRKLVQIYNLQNQISVAYTRENEPEATESKASNPSATNVLPTTVNDSIVTNSANKNVSLTAETNTNLLLVKINDEKLPSLVHTRASYFIYKEQGKVEVTSWRQLYTGICNQLLQEYGHDCLYYIDKDTTNSITLNIVEEHQKHKLLAPCPLLYGYYIECRLNVSDIMHRLQKIVQFYNLQDQITIACTRETATDNPELKASSPSATSVLPTTTVTDRTTTNISPTAETNAEMLVVKLNDEKLPPLVHTKASYFIYKTQGKVEVTSWRQVYTEICNQLLREYGNDFLNRIDKDTPNSVRLNIVKEHQKYKLLAPSPLLYGYYIESTLNVSAIMHKLQKVVQIYHLQNQIIIAYTTLPQPDQKAKRISKINDWIIQQLEARHCDYQDKRDQGGCLWIENQDGFAEFAQQCKQQGYTLQYRPNGCNAFPGCQVWWTQDGAVSTEQPIPEDSEFSKFLLSNKQFSNTQAQAYCQALAEIKQFITSNQLLVDFDDSSEQDLQIVLGLKKFLDWDDKNDNRYSTVLLCYIEFVHQKVAQQSLDTDTIKALTFKLLAENNEALTIAQITQHLQQIQPRCVTVQMVYQTILPYCQIHFFFIDKGTY